MKIFQIITVSEYGGAQSVVTNLLDKIAEEHDVFILYGGNGEAWQVVDKKVNKIKISKHQKGFSFGDFVLLLRLFYYRVKYKPDIVHLHSSKMGALGRIAFNPKKIVYTVHGFDSMRKAFKKFLFVEKILKNRTARIVGVSQYDVDGLKEEGISKNVELVYNGLIDYTQDPGMEELSGLLDKFAEIKSSYPRIIMCISRISKQKKFDFFIGLAKQMPRYAFVWIGNKTEMAGLPSNVFCLGEVYAAHMYLKQADLFILPSNYEGLPISILEALSYSLPVVASDVGGVSEILNGKNGFAVENEIEAFINKIEYCLDEDVREQMKLAARASYLERFTVDKMLNGYMKIYKQLYEGQRK
ncbi:glycosyltransferase [Viscerimonas tarda]